MSKLTKKYFQFPLGRKEWCVTGEHGSVCFWTIPTEWGEKRGKMLGAIEYHYSNPQEYMSRDEPSNSNCPYNNGPCWHDGTSLLALEHWIPNILPKGDDYIWQELESTYKKELGGTT